MRNSDFLLILLFATAVAGAAERELTLSEALSSARLCNHDLAAAAARVDQAAAGVEQARSSLLPSLSGRAAYTRNNTGIEIPLPFAGGDVVIQKENQLEARADLVVPLVVPAAYPQVSAARRSFDAAALDYRASESDLLFATARAFFAAAASDEIIVARRHALTVAEETSAQAAVRFEAGKSFRTEVGRSELAVVRARQAVVDAEQARATAYRALATVSGVTGAVRAVPSESARDDQQPLEQLIAIALERRAEIAAISAHRSAAAERERAGRWRWAPTLSAFANGRSNNYAGFSGDEQAWAAGVQLEWMFYDGGLRDAARHLASAERREHEARLAQLRARIADDVADARGAIDSKSLAVAASERACALAQETLTLARAQRDAGSATELELLQAQDDLVSAEVARAQARYERSLANITLMHALGQFPEPTP
jgi:outer membrane protein TolC